MSGGIPPLPRYAFMAWCSLKAQGQLYFTLLYFTLLYVTLPLTLPLHLPMFLPLIYNNISFDGISMIYLHIDGLYVWFLCSIIVIKHRS
jgi:hypothetical protein